MPDSRLQTLDSQSFMAKPEHVRDILDPIAHQLQNPQELDRVLYQIARATAEHFDAAGCRVWLIRRGDLCQTCRWAPQCADKRRCLHLKAGSGAPIDDAYRRAPLDIFNHETISRGGIADWTRHEPEFEVLIDRAWAEQQSLVSFATLPLRVENRVVGLMAVFSRKLIYPADFREMGGFAAYAATAIRVAEQIVRVQRAEAATQEKARELAQTTRLLNTILNVSSDQAIMIEDLEGNILAFNTGAHRMYGYSPEEVVGKANSEKLYAPEDRVAGRIMDIFKTVMEQGAHECVIRRMRKNGELFLERSTLTLQRDEEGDPAGFLMVARELDRDAAPAQLLRPQTLVLDAVERLLALRRTDRLPAEMLKQLATLVSVEEGVAFLLEGKALVVRGTLGYEGGESFVGFKTTPDRAEEPFRLVTKGDIIQVTPDILPEELASRSKADPHTPLWAVPLVQDGPVGLIVLTPPRGVRYSAADLETIRQFLPSALRMLDHSLLVEQINDQLRHLQARYSSLEHEHRLLCEQSSDLQVSRAQLLEHSGNIEADLVRLSGRHRQIAQESSELKSYSVELEQTLESMKERQAALQKQADELRPVAERAQGMEKRVAELEAENTQLKSNLAEAGRHYEHGYQRVAERNALLEKKIEELQYERHERDARLRILEEQNAVREQLQAANSELETERAAWQVTRERLETEVRQAEVRVQDHVAHIRRLEAGLAQAYEQRNDARNALESARRAADHAQNSLASINETIENLQNRLALSEAECADLKRALELTEARTTEALVHKEKLVKANADLGERLLLFQAESKRLGEEAERLRDAAAQARDSQVKSLQLEQANQTLENLLRNLRSEYETAEAERLRLTAQLTDLREMHELQISASTAEKLLADASFDEERGRLHERISVLQDEVAAADRLRAEHREVVAEYAKLSGLAGNWREELAEAQAALDGALNEVRETASRADAFKSEIERLRDASAIRETELDRLRTEIARLEAIPPFDPSPLNARIAELEAEATEARTQRIERESEIGRLTEEIARRDEVIGRVQGRMDDLNERAGRLAAVAEEQQTLVDGLRAKIEEFQVLQSERTASHERRVAELESLLAEQRETTDAHRESLSRLTAEILAVNTENNRLIEERNALAVQLVELTGEVKRLNEELAVREADAVAARLALEKIEERRARELARYEGLRMLYDSLSAANLETKLLYGAAMRERQTLEEEVRKLRLLGNAHDHAVRERDALAGEVLRMRAETAESAVVLAALEAKLEEAVRNNTELAREREALAEEVLRTRAETAESAVVLAALEAKLEEAVRNNTELSREREALAEEVLRTRAETAESAVVLAALEAKLEEAVRNNAELSREREALAEEVLRTRAETAKNAALMEKLEVCLEDKTLEYVELADAYSRRQIRYEQACQNLSKRLRNLEIERSAWIALVGRTEQTVTQLRELDAERNALRVRLEAALALNRELDEARVSEAETLRGEYEARLRDLEREARQAVAALETMKSATIPPLPTDDAPERIRLLQERLTKEEHRNVDLNRHNFDLGVQNAELRDAVEELEEQLAEASTVCASLELELTALRAEFEAARTMPKAPPQSVVEEEKADSQPGTSGRRVVLASDHPQVRKLAEKIVLDAGHGLKTIPDGDAVLSGLLVEIPDLLILNLENSQFDGTEVLRSIRRNPDWRRLPVILILPPVFETTAGLPPIQTETLRVILRDRLSERGLAAAVRDLLGGFGK